MACNICAIEAAALLTRLEGGSIETIRLLKMLYLADRDALEYRGCPITQGRTVAAKSGPHNIDVFNAINGLSPTSPEWFNVFRKDGHLVHLLLDREGLDLSENDIEKLTSAFERYRNTDTWELVENTRKLSEWKEYYVEGECREIPIEAVLNAVGHSPEDAREFANEWETFMRIRRCHASR